MRGHIPDEPTPSEQVLQVWQGFPEISRRLALAVVLGWLLSSLMPSLVSTLSLCPRNTFGLHLWNLVTYVLVETSLISALISGALVAMMGRLVEPIWGPQELMKFVGVWILQPCHVI